MEEEGGHIILEAKEEVFSKGGRNNNPKNVAGRGQHHNHKQHSERRYDMVSSKISLTWL